MRDLNLSITLRADGKAATAELARVSQAHRALVADLQKKIASIGAFEAANRDLEKLQKALDEAKRKRDFFARSAELGGDAGFKLYRRDIEAANAALQRATTAVDRQRGVVATLGASLRAAGIDTARLATEQARLAGEIKRADATFQFQAAGLRSIGDAGRTAAAAVRPLGQSLQGAATGAGALRGGLAGVGRSMAFLAADALLVHNALKGLRSVLEVGSQFQRLGDAMRFATGSAEGAADALAYIRTTSEALGLPLQTVGLSFGKLAAAARGTALEGKATRDIFTAVAGASRVMGVSTQDLEGVLLAVSQIMSKGTVSAEELRGQLGERLPGAFQIAARAMGVTTAELGKLLEQGQVAATDFLPKFAAELQKSIAGSLPDAVRTFDAELARLKNSLVELGNEIAQSGALEEFTQLVRDAAAEMRRMAQTGELQAFAKDLADSLRTAAGLLRDIVPALAAHHEAVLGLIGAYVALRAAMFAAGAVKFIGELAPLAARLAAVATGAKAAGLAIAALPFAAAAAGIAGLVGALDEASEAMRRARENAQGYVEAQRRLMAENAAFADRRVTSPATAAQARAQEEELARTEQFWRAKMLLEEEQLKGATKATRDRLALARQELAQAKTYGEQLLSVEQQNAQRQMQVREQLNADLKTKLDNALALRQSYLDSLADAAQRQAEVEQRFAETRQQINQPKPNELIKGTVLETGRTLEQGQAALDKGDLQEAARLAEAARQQIAALGAEGKASAQYLNTLLDMAHAIATQAGAAEKAGLEEGVKAAETAINNLRNQAAALAAIPVGFDGPTALQSAADLRSQMEAVLAATPIIVPVVTSQQLDAGGKQDLLGNVEGRAYGGALRGPGSDRSDNLLFMGSPGEYVVQAPSVRSVGLRVMEYINRYGRLPQFAFGGQLGRAETMPARSALPDLERFSVQIGGGSYASYAEPDVAVAMSKALRLEVVRRGRR